MEPVRFHGFSSILHGPAIEDRMLAAKSAHLKFVVLLLLASAGPVVAQEAGDSPAGARGVTLKVNARLTLVDVTVTDAKGKPVHGLTQADFTVKEDGKPQP